MKGLHIIRHTTDGITIQFYAILITALLMLKLKQDILTQSESFDSANSKKSLNFQQPSAQYSRKSKPYQFFNMIGDKIDKFWKIGIHWLSVLQEILAKPFNDQAVNVLSS